MITGDRNIFTPGTSAEARFALQRGAVEELRAVYWGPDSWCPPISEDAVDVVTAQDPFWRGLFALWVARRKKAALNVQVHTDLAAYGWLRRALARHVLQSADTVRVVSNKIKQQVERMGVRGRISVLPIYVDLARFRGLEHRPQQQKTILWVGRFESEKDPARAIGVLREVREAGIDASLIMLGAGSLEQELRALAEGLPVEFPGWQDPVTYVAMADVVLSTSKHESFGAGIIEALAAGVPAVGPDVGLLREAGASIADWSELGARTIEALRRSARGELKLTLPDAQEWTEAWANTLI